MPIGGFWLELKDWLLPHDQSLRSLVHVHVGLAMYIAASLATKRRFDATWPLLLLYALEMANEANDMLGHFEWSWTWRWRDALSDVLHTVAWPTILHLLLRSKPRASLIDDDELCEG